MEKKIIGAIDLGASGGKMFLGTFESGGFKFEEVNRFVNEPVDIYSLSNEKFVQKTYWNDLQIYKNIVESLKLVSRRGISRIDSLGIDTWGADGVLVSSRGELIDRLYNYRDHRLDNIRDELFRIIPEKELYFLTGIPSHQFNQINQLFWLVKNRPEYLKASEFFSPVSSLFCYYLGGYKFVEYTWATTTQLLDPVKKCWSKPIFDRLGIPMSIMPPVVMPGSRLGGVFSRLLEDVSLEACELTAAPSHDTASAYYAAPVDDEKSSLIISSGTWSLVGKLVPEPVINDFTFGKHFTNEGGVGNIRLLRNVMGTWILQELKKQWEHDDKCKFSWEELIQLAEGAGEFSAFIDPDHSSFFNPDNMEDAVKSFCRRTGQNVPVKRSAILRVCYESLAMKCSMVNTEIEKASGTKNTTIYVVGGGAQNTILNRFISEATGLTVYAGPVEATGAGNILLQASSMGIIASDAKRRELLRKTFDIAVYKGENSRMWKKNFPRFNQIAGCSI